MVSIRESFQFNQRFSNTYNATDESATLGLHVQHDFDIFGALNKKEVLK
jgi:hypothetical protein